MTSSPAQARLLTPPGTGAVATVEVCGTQAWDTVHAIFCPTGRTPLPGKPTLHRFWFGRFGSGGDDVILAVKQVQPDLVLEIHSHGGRRVVRWILEQLATAGCVEGTAFADEPWALLERARTLRTAAILLDQGHGAFDRAVSDAIAALDGGDIPGALGRIERLAAYGTLGRHLIEPWKVVVAGAPNVGKSSLINALAGYQRSVVSDVPGTTRDVVTVPVAFDGWPVELADTAGLRRAADSLEVSGIELAQQFLRAADLVIWVLDCTADEPILPRAGDGLAAMPMLFVLNKTDQPAGLDHSHLPDCLPVSAATGAGIGGLAARVIARFVPHSPAPGAAVPYTPALVATIDSAVTALRNGTVPDARRLLAACLAEPRPAESSSRPDGDRHDRTAIDR